MRLPGVLLLMAVLTLSASADTTAPQDPRLEIERHTDTIFKMTEYPTLEAWEKDAATLRRRILASSGLYPMPEKTPLNAHIFDRQEYGDYSIEKVYFEAWPGFLVTGNLFRPVGKKGPFPGVLCPHGHWEHGRLEDSVNGSVPARGITLARMGMVAFNYDMLAYNDSIQFKNHRFVDWEDTLWAIHPFGLQLWSSIRAVDFLESLPDVDKDRLACTGASGGGTQTFALTAVDPRIKVAAPVNMISHTMQGGCVCENAPFIRLEHSNMEIGALTAPRPMIMVSATGDWTKATPEVEYPAVRSIYELYGAADNLDTVQFDAPHNYNKDSRTAVYRFLGRHLLPDTDWSAYEEPPYTLPETDKMRVFPDNKLPGGIPADEAVVKDTIRNIQKRKMDAIMSAGDAAMLADIRSVLREIMGIKFRTDAALELAQKEGAAEIGAVVVDGASLKIPAARILVASETSDSATIVVHPEGKGTVLKTGGKEAHASISGALPGNDVIAIDVFLAGVQEAPARKTGRAFDDTFLPTDCAYRVQDILDTAAALRNAGYDRIHVSGTGTAGLWVLFAAALDEGISGYTIDESVLPQSDKDWARDRRDRIYYVPCINALGGVEMLKKLAER